MRKNEIEFIVDKRNNAFVEMMCLQERIERDHAPVEYLKDIESGIMTACVDILKMANVDLNKCGLIDYADAVKKGRQRYAIEKKIQLWRNQK